MAGDVEVEDGDGLARPNLGDLDPAAQRTEWVAGLEVARHHPTAARQPEAVVGAGDDLLAVVEPHPDGRSRLVMMNGRHRLERECAGGGVRSEDEIAGLD